jgi:hypothetical protein
VALGKQGSVDYIMCYASNRMCFIHLVICVRLEHIVVICVLSYVSYVQLIVWHTIKYVLTSLVYDVSDISL